MGKIIEIEIGIAKEIETCCNNNRFATDFDSDFDPEKNSSETFKAYLDGVGWNYI